MRGTPRHAEFSRWGEWFHAAAVNSGGERSWISAAVSLSMIFMGPPQLGHVHHHALTVDVADF